MNNVTRLVRAQPHHVDEVAAALRPADAVAFGLIDEDDPVAGLRGLLERSDLAGAGLLPCGTAGGLWGAMPDALVAPTGAYVWLVLAVPARRLPHQIARHARLFLAEAQTVYGALATAMIEGQPPEDTRFVEWLGFQRAPAGDTWLKGRRLLAYARR